MEGAGAFPMSTAAPGTVLSPDDAYTQFKIAEGTYTSILAGQANAAAALAAAQQAKAQSDSALSDAQTNVMSAANALIASLQSFEQGLPTGTAALPATGAGAS
jgi:hypothetical protein